uniref:Uncharacterized protein n=1 Tax=Anguilla anguilla TaxID=7936 RepID=A0A0E9UHG7_ANGAN
MAFCASLYFSIPSFCSLFHPCLL